VNFRSDEKEENGVGGSEDEARKEEGCEDENVIANVTSSVCRTGLSVLHHTGNNQYSNARSSPREQVVVLLQLASSRVTFNDHLVKVKGNAETPEEVGQQEVVDKTSKDSTDKSVNIVIASEIWRGTKRGVPDDDCDAQVHDQFDRVRPDTRENEEGDYGAEGGHHGNTKECFGDMVNDFIE